MQNRYHIIRPNGASAPCAESLLALRADLDHCLDLASKWHLARGFLAGLGVDLPIYMYLRPSAPQDRPMIFSAMPDWWADHYLEAELAATDPFFKPCHTLAPVPTGRDYVQENAYMLSAEEAEFIRQAGETGLRSGVSCTVRRANAGHFGGWNFGSCLPRPEYEALLREHGAGLHLAGLLVHQSFQESAAQTAPPPSCLSPRERECLLWLAQGLRTAQIADQIGLASVTVDLHLKGARKKLEAATREEALAKAIMSGEISL